MSLEPSPPTVTAVTIFLNAEKYIVEAIESVLAQTRDDWELVLVDDGSTDGSTALARGYAARHRDKIRYVEHEGHVNRGMSVSRNVGAASGRGRYISFLDADDVWLPRRLERFLATAESFPSAGMVYGPTLYWYSWAAERGMEPPAPGQDDFPGHLDLPAGVLIPPPEPMRRFLESGGGCLPGICSLLIRREAFAAVGGFEPDFRGLYEDQVFLSKMALRHPVVIVDEILDHYRQHAESCCYRAIETGEYHPDRMHPARARYLTWLEKYLLEHDIDDRTVWRTLSREIWPYRYPALGRLSEMAERAGRAARRGLKRRLPLPVHTALQTIVRRFRRDEVL